jgi:hypothetical protein
MSWSNAEFRDSQHRQLKSHCDLMSHSCWVEVRDFDWHRSDVVSDGYQVWMYIDGELDLQNRPFRKTADNFPCVSARGKPHNVINAGPDACDIQFWSASGGDNNDPIRVPTGGVK